MATAARDIPGGGTAGKAIVDPSLTTPPLFAIEKLADVAEVVVGG